MKLSIYDKAMLRIPQFSMDAQLKENWPQLKLAIAQASPGFYLFIEQVQAVDLDDLPLPVAFTVWKYFNRAKFRATPFGSFAGISTIQLDDQETVDQLTIAKDQVIHEFIDWPAKDSVSNEIEQIIEQDHFLYANSNHYRLKDSIRYLSFQQGLHQLSAISYQDLHIAILQKCHKPIRYSKLSLILMEEGHVEEGRFEEEITDAICALWSSQLLLSSLHPNVIGQDYFERIGMKPENAGSYQIAERKIISGNFSKAKFSAVPQLLELLASRTNTDAHAELRKFIQAFYRKFENAKVPIMFALDPECGLPYGSNEEMVFTDELINELHSSTRKPVRKESGLFSDRLLSYLINETAVCQTIDLEKLLAEIPSKTPRLPNSLSVLLTFGGDNQLVVESIGGVTANSLLGRFSLIGGETADCCRNIAELEQQANPEVLFFDIACTGENEVDNVNRRLSIYDHQLRILNYDTSNDPISLTDLVLYVQNDELMLHSWKLNKRLIPRLATAYNYKRSSLPLLRLLGDLQAQGLQVNFGIDLPSILPSLARYPRVQYKNLIVSPAQWKIETIADLKSQSVGRYFNAGQGDQTLCFDQENEKDMEMFNIYLKKMESLYVKEAFLPEKSLMTNSDLLPYTAQIVLSLVHQQEIYTRINPVPTVKEAYSSVKVIPPGYDWLYFEVYCPPHFADRLLSDLIASFLEKHSQKIRKWFFIRYTENGDHLRIRLQLCKPKDSQDITAQFSKLLRDELSWGRVSDLSIRTYKREIERYIGSQIRDIETHFYHDSRFVLSLIPDGLTSNQKYHLAIVLAERFADTNIFSLTEFKALIVQLCDAHNEEHGINTTGFKRINAAYKLYLIEERKALNTGQSVLLESYTHSFLLTIRLCKVTNRAMLFSDLFHMHFNRLFNEAQRSHEMVFYNFLLKDLKKRIYH